MRREGVSRKRGQKASREIALERMRKAYDDRDTLVCRLGFPSYREYLRSLCWYTIRHRVLYNAGGSCHFCGHTATHVHHGAYTRRNLLGHSLNKLYAVCDACHEAGEYTSTRQKLSPVDATRRMRAIANRR